MSPKVGANFYYLLVCALVSLGALVYWSSELQDGHSANVRTMGEDPDNMMDHLITVGGREPKESEENEEYALENGSQYTTTGRAFDTSEHSSKNEQSPELATQESGDNLKTILFWNSWYHRTTYGFGAGRGPFYQFNCPETRCTTTDDASQLGKADAVVVCGRLLDWSIDPVVPDRRDPEQVFVYFNNEAPVKTLGKTERLNHVFNVTMTYRSDSTIPFPYSEIVPRTDRSNYRPVTREDIKYKSHTHLVSWMVSRCNKPGCVRHEYAEQLNEHIPVDVYGRCGPLKCQRYDNGTCMDYQNRKYKFYLALENTVCVDYVTEKAFRTLKYTIVPIVMGGANYTKIMPPHSFIDVQDFESPAHLAEYLRHLDQHDEEYLEYFAWKKDFEVRDVSVDEPFCKLCELLHTQSQFLVDFDLEQWWDGGGGEACVSNRELNYLYDYFHIKPPAQPRTRGRGPKGQARQLLLQQT